MSGPPALGPGTSALAVPPTWADLLDAAGPGRYRVGRFDPGGSGETLTFADFTDPDTVGGLVDDGCARLVTHERSAVGFGLFHGVAAALLTPLVAGLLIDSDELRVTDLTGTRLVRGGDGFVGTMWLRTVALDVPPSWGTIAVGGWAGVVLDDVVDAFVPHVRGRRRGYAAAAGWVLAQRADLLGRRIGDVGRARRVVHDLALAAGPAIRSVPYVDVPVARGCTTAPRITVCCRRYRLADGDLCTGCPRRPGPGRWAHRRLLSRRANRR